LDTLETISILDELLDAELGGAGRVTPRIDGTGVKGAEVDCWADFLGVLGGERDKDVLIGWEKSTEAERLVAIGTRLCSIRLAAALTGLLVCVGTGLRIWGGAA
jgi:hypothetical protein